jgi:hypothetical protein
MDKVGSVTHLFPRGRTMTTATISIEVDADTAQAFVQASAEKQRKLQLLLGLRLRELTTVPTRPLHEIMDDIGREAEARGLTPEIVESLLFGMPGSKSIHSSAL